MYFKLLRSDKHHVIPDLLPEGSASLDHPVYSSAILPDTFNRTSCYHATSVEATIFRFYGCLRVAASFRFVLKFQKVFETLQRLFTSNPRARYLNHSTYLCRLYYNQHIDLSDITGKTKDWPNVTKIWPLTKILVDQKYRIVFHWYYWKVN